MRTGLFSVTLLLTLALPALLDARVSWAQRNGGKTTVLGEDDDDDDDASDTVELGSDDAPVGAVETPDAVPEFGRGVTEEQQVAAAAPMGYPLEGTQRPLTLLEGMFEIGLSLPAIASPVQLRSELAASYGITDRVQIGIGYGPGTLASTDNTDPFAVGKAIRVGGRYLVFDWLAAQVSVPMYVDPFALGFTAGPAMKFRVFGKAALLFGQDLVTFRVYRFAPQLADELENRARVVAVNTNAQQPRGELRMVGGVMYQINPKLTCLGEFGVIAPDFSLADPVVPLRVTFTHSSSRAVDLGVRVGFNNLDHALDEFGVMLTAGLRVL